jgi:ABC-type dipeptide/oligopeptide/nickel transport system permease component
MFVFLLRRLLSLIPLLLGVTLLASILMTLSPGDVLSSMRANPDIPDETVEAMERDFGLVDAEGEPSRWYVRYGAWLSQVLQGNFGESMTYRVGVGDLLLQRVPATVILSATSILFAWAIAIPLGVLAAIKKDSIFDRLSSLLAYAALSIPEFFLAIIAVYFAALTGWFPVGGRSSIGSEFWPWYASLADMAWHLVLPTIVLGIGSVAGMMRIMRANFIDEMRHNYVDTARAKGMPEGRVMFIHVLRNAINPLITAMGYAFASLMSGALLVENVMNYPGLGQLVYEALLAEDTYVVMASLMIATVMLVAGNTLADLLLAWTDPRTRLSSQRKSNISPVKVAAFAACLLLFIGAEIALEAFFPGLIPLALTVLKWLALALVIALALSCLGLVGYAVVVLTKRLLGPVLKRPLGAISLGLLAVMYIMAAFAQFIAPYEAHEQNLAHAYHPPTPLALTLGGLKAQSMELADPLTRTYTEVEDSCEPLVLLPRVKPYKLWGFIPMQHKLFGIASEDPDTRVYLLGSDTTGRCVFSRLLYGAQVSLTIGLIGIAITMTLGFLVGGLAGYFGGSVDFVAMRVVELLMSIPSLYLLLALRSALFEPGLSATQVYLAIVVILSILGWAGAARIIRGMSLSLAQRPYVLAARSMGVGHFKILFAHILPNLTSYLLVAATLAIPGYILGEAALSFLGLGISEPSASWGLMLRQSQSDMKVFFLGFWWLLTPGLAIFLTVVAFNVLGDVLRDVVDPRSNKHV